MVYIVKDDARRLRMRLFGRAGVAIKPGVASEQQRAAKCAYGEIARRCHVSAMTVGRIKKSLNLKKDEVKYKDKHGNVTKMKLDPKAPGEITTLKHIEQMEEPGPCHWVLSMRRAGPAALSSLLARDRGYDHCYNAAYVEWCRRHLGRRYCSKGCTRWLYILYGWGASCDCTGDVS